jgi:hypothetical protein
MHLQYFPVTNNHLSDISYKKLVLSRDECHQNMAPFTDHAWNVPTKSIYMVWLWSPLNDFIERLKGSHETWS